MTETTRINKSLADRGLCSRREADALITRGQVLVNGQTAVLGQVISASDKVEIIGKQPDRIYLAYYKGRGIITHSPTDQETDIATRLETDYQLSGVYPVGRLDKDSEGLMILTNDGRVTGPLLDSSRNIEKTYELEVDKPINGQLTKQLSRGVNIEGYQTKPAKASKLTPYRLKLTITEGKKHQIRRMCAALGYQVKFLKRTQIANIELAKLKPNQYRKLRPDEQTTLLKRLEVI